MINLVQYNVQLTGDGQKNAEIYSRLKAMIYENIPKLDCVMGGGKLYGAGALTTENLEKLEAMLHTICVTYALDGELVSTNPTTAKDTTVWRANPWKAN